MPMQNPEAIGAVPAQGNPVPAQGSKLTPEQVKVLKKDPELVQAASQFVGSPVTLENLPENALAELAGAVHKLGVMGAVNLLKQKIPQQIQDQIKAAVTQQAPTPQTAGPRG